MKRTIDIFQKKQIMDSSDYELYLYSDPKTLTVYPHSHTFYELYYLLSEQIDYIIGNHVYHLKKGDFLLLPPGLLHYPSTLSLLPNTKYERIILWISIPCFENLIKLDPDLNHILDAIQKNSSYHIRPSSGTSHRLLTSLLLLLDEQEYKGFASNAMIQSLLLQILVQVNRIVFHVDYFEKHTPVSNLFNSILYYIHTHLTEELSLEILSKKFFVSKGYISRIFREYLDISVHQYILSLRLEGCKNAISHGALITVVAETFGFQDYSSFFRAFKKAFGMSPKQYQKNYGRVKIETKNKKNTP